MVDNSGSGSILIYPFEFIGKDAIYSQHLGKRYINIGFWDGHAEARSKNTEPYMFRLRDPAGGGDLNWSPYVADNGRADPDGLWRS